MSAVLPSFTATLVDRSDVTGVDAVTVVYSNDSQKYERTYTSAGFMDAQLESIAQNEVAGFQNISAAPGKSKYTVGSQINLTPAAVVVTPPTAAQIAQAQFQTDYALLESMQRGIAAGLKTAQDADYTAQLKLVQGEYLPAYVGLL